MRIKFLHLFLLPFVLTGCGSKSKELDYIEVNKEPNNVEYFVGESFNPEGMEVKAFYDDKTDEIINDYSYSPTGPLSISDTKITISYMNKTTDLSITVNEPVKPIEDYIVDMVLLTNPTKRVYYVGEEFDPLGCTIKVTRSISGESVFDLKDLIYSGFDSSKVGQQTITVYYENWTVDFKVEIKEVEPLVLDIKSVKDLIKSTKISTNRAGIGISDIKVCIVGLALERFTLVKTTKSFDLDISTPYKSFLVDKTGYIACASKELFDKINDHAQKDTSTYSVTGYLSLYLNQPEIFVTDFVWDKDIDVNFDLSTVSNILTVEQYKDAATKANYNCAGHGYGEIVRLNDLRCYYSDTSISYLSDGETAIKVVNKNTNYVVGSTYDVIGRIAIENYSPAIISYMNIKKDNDISEALENAYIDISINNLMKISYPQDDTFDRQEDYTKHCLNLYKTTGYLSLAVENGKYYVGLSDSYIDKAITGKANAFKSMVLIDNNNFWNITESELATYNPYYGEYILEEKLVTLYYSINQCKPVKNNVEYKITLTPSLIIENEFI